MRRVVVTGMGVVSSIGNNPQEVTSSLREAKSGIIRAEKYAELGFRCQVHGAPNIDWEAIVPRKPKRFMEAGVGWNYIAMDQAIKDSGLEPGSIVNEKTGIIMGSGGPSTRAVVWAADTARNKSPKQVGPFEVTKGMCSGTSAVLATSFQIKGVNYSISSACSTSAHCIGNAAELIQWGKQDIIFAGGCEELDWTLSVLFDGMGAMSSRYNDTPATASRAYDKNRDGFVIAGGAGVLVLEELEHAKARGAHIYGEIAGYGATGDAYQLTGQPENHEGLQRAMKRALEDASLTPADIQYINAHGTSTPLNDPNEIRAIKAVFGPHATALNVSSTKSSTGHMLGAAGAVEAIFTTLAIVHGKIPPTINLQTPDPECDLDCTANVPATREVTAALSNSSGFGGHNVSIALKRYKE